MERRVKFWQALAAALAAAAATWFGFVPPKPAPLPAAPPIDSPATPPPPPTVTPDPVGAIARIQFGNSGCTGTVIAPRRPDGRWDVLTAAHCVSTRGQHGTIRFRDGRASGVVVTAIDRTSDCAWLVTESNETFPFAVLAPTDPLPGDEVWHHGYGIDKPDNREDGVVVAPANAQGQIEFRLSVSSGDSGGAIALNRNGQVVGAVCCTTARGQVARVWGCSPTSAARLRGERTEIADQWTPIDIPLRMEP
jgi:hypothetical protein